MPQSIKPESMWFSLCCETAFWDSAPTRVMVASREARSGGLPLVAAHHY
jgi:hypothetical protein